MIPIATSEAAYGSRTPTRQAVGIRSREFSNAASRTAITICGPLDSRKMLTVLTSVR